MSNAAAATAPHVRKRAGLTIAQAVSAQLVVRVLVYCRISSDPRKQEEGVKRQETLARIACELRTNERERWEIVRVVVDDDESNSIARKRERTNFPTLLDQMEAGTTGADLVMVFDQDRFVKDPEDWGRWMSLTLKGRGLRFATLDERGNPSELNLTTTEGFMSSTFQMMSANTATMAHVKRQRAHAFVQQSSGKTGGRVMYGWRRQIINDDQGYRKGWYDELHSEQSAIIRELAQRVLAGESISSIARDLDARGVPTPSNGRKIEAKRWENSTITRLLTRPANAGLRVLDDGTEQPIANPAILDRATWKRVELTLRDPKRRTITDNRVRHLLAGIAECGVCKANDEPSTMRRIRISYKARGSEYVFHGYTCKRYRHVGAKQSDVDSIVEDVVLGWFAKIDPRELLDTSDDDERALRQAADELELLEAELRGYVADSKRRLGDPLRISRDELNEQRAALVPQIEDARRRATPTSVDQSSPSWALANAADPRKLWGSLTLEQQRSVIAAYFTVTISAKDPSLPRNVFDARRVDVRRK